MPLGHYSPTRLFTGSTIPAADSHAKCSKVTPRGARQAGIVKVNRASSTIPAADSHAKCGKVTPRGARQAGIVKVNRAGSSIAAAVSGTPAKFRGQNLIPNNQNRFL